MEGSSGGGTELRQRDVPLVSAAILTKPLLRKNHAPIRKPVFPEAPDVCPIETGDFILVCRHGAGRHLSGTNA